MKARPIVTQPSLDSRGMVEIVEITDDVTDEQCTECEIERTWRTLKSEDEARVASKALSIFRTVPIYTLVPPPSPVRRNSEVRRRPASPSWIDGIFAEMKQAEVQQQGRTRRSPKCFSPPKRTRWSVEDVASALGSCSVSGTRSTTALGTFCPPRVGATPANSPQTSQRLVRYGKRQQQRAEARKSAVNAKRANGETSGEQLELLESMLSKLLAK